MFSHSRWCPLLMLNEARLIRRNKHAFLPFIKEEEELRVAETALDIYKTTQAPFGKKVKKRGNFFSFRL